MATTAWQVWCCSILQAGYFKAETLFFSFEIDEVADDVKHILQQQPAQADPSAIQNIINRPASDKVPVHQLSHLEHRDNLLAVEYRQ